MNKGLESILRCPTTGQSLVWNGTLLVNADNTVQYHRVHNHWVLIPDPLPATLADVAETWRILQANAAPIYAADPDQNLATDPALVKALEEGFALSGRVLDIGCGPQKHQPLYTRRAAEFIGIDPLSGSPEREFTFFVALGEAIPFCDNIFDNVVFCSSLDHMLDFRLALREALRVAKPRGSVRIWMDDMGDDRSQSTLTRAVHLIGRGVNQFASAARRKGVIEAARYSYRLARMPVPAGAVDMFHSHFPSFDEVACVLRGHGCEEVRSRPLGGGLLVTAVKI
jgi:ubiquinone/menaquinone biosynthesis C-methylase UbiE